MSVLTAPSAVETRHMFGSQPGRRRIFSLGEEVPFQLAHAPTKEEEPRKQRYVFALGEEVPMRHSIEHVAKAHLKPFMEMEVSLTEDDGSTQAADALSDSQEEESSVSSSTSSALAIASAEDKLPSVLPALRPREARRIIFLDVDGVLHAAHGARSSFNCRCMKLLAELVRNTSAEVVLSSSWRLWSKGIGRDAVDAALVKYGMAKTIGQTPSCSKGRDVEILEWLQRNAPCCTTWVALDDLDLSNELGHHMILTDPEEGLQEANVLDAVAVLLEYR